MQFLQSVGKLSEVTIKFLKQFQEKPLDLSFDSLKYYVKNTSLEGFNFLAYFLKNCQSRYFKEVSNTQVLLFQQYYITKRISKIFPICFHKNFLGSLFHKNFLGSHLFFLCSFPLFSSWGLGVIIIFILVSVKISLCIWTFDHEVSKFLCFDDNNVYCRVNYSYILPFEFLGVFLNFSQKKFVALEVSFL